MSDLSAGSIPSWSRRDSEACSRRSRSGTLSSTTPANIDDPSGMTMTHCSRSRYDKKGSTPGLLEHCTKFSDFVASTLRNLSWLGEIGRELLTGCLCVAGRVEALAARHGESAGGECVGAGPLRPGKDTRSLPSLVNNIRLLTNSDGDLAPYHSIRYRPSVFDFMTHFHRLLVFPDAEEGTAV